MATGKETIPIEWHFMERTRMAKAVQDEGGTEKKLAQRRRRRRRRRRRWRRRKIRLRSSESKWRALVAVAGRCLMSGAASGAHRAGTNTKQNARN